MKSLAIPKCKIQKINRVKKARRPRTAYNFFYKDQRISILKDVYDTILSRSDSPWRKRGLKTEEFFLDYSLKRRRHEKSHVFISIIIIDEADCKTMERG